MAGQDLWQTEVWSPADPRRAVLAPGCVTLNIFAQGTLWLTTFSILFYFSIERQCSHLKISILSYKFLQFVFPCSGRDVTHSLLRVLC